MRYEEEQCYHCGRWQICNRDQLCEDCQCNPNWVFDHEDERWEVEVEDE